MLPVASAHAQLLTGFGSAPPPKAEPAVIHREQPSPAESKPQPSPLTAFGSVPAAAPAKTGTLTGMPASPSPALRSKASPPSGIAAQAAPYAQPVLTSFGAPSTRHPLTGMSPSVPEITNYPKPSPVIDDGNPMQRPASPDAAPVDLQADRLTNNEAEGTVTASGNVMLVQAGRILRADEITYFVDQDRVIAKGYVVLNEDSGDIHTAEEVELRDEMKSGFVRELKTYLADGSRFIAKKGNRKNAQTTTMEEATYTACDPCKENPEKAPVWQIKADEVVYHEDEHRIAYHNAWFEFYGIPVAYTPYFSHPDGTIERKSGFLSPTFGLDSRTGFNAESSYYWAIAPDKDATIGMRAFTKQLPLMTAEWRQRWDTASLKLNGGATYSDRTDKRSNVNYTTDDEVRGHLFADGLWDINDKWRSGLKVQYASDDQYLRQYDFSSEDVLENQIYLERFSGRNYTSGRLITFQDVRIGDLQSEDQPQVLPEIISSWVGEPGSMPLIGGRWSMEGSLLGLRRPGHNQDMARMSLETGWNRRLISDLGLVTTVDGTLRGDYYAVKDRDMAFVAGNPDEDDTEHRFFPQLHVQSSYPLARDFNRFQMRVEPVASITVAPRMNNEDEIPNEDSQDVQLDTLNLFKANRFPGFDRVEDGTRVTYGMRTGFYGYETSSVDLFLGQSHRFDDKNNPFPAGSGLNGEYSDYVGEINANYKDDYYLNYRFQLDQENFRSSRHEVEMNASIMEKIDLNMNYLYANALERTTIDESREQVAGSLGYRWNDEWRSTIGAVQDLGINPGLRTGYIGLEHFGQCLNWSVAAVRNLTDDASGDSSTELVFRIGLKNLGEFQASGIEVASSSSSDDNDDLDAFSNGATGY